MSPRVRPTVDDESEVTHGVACRLLSIDGWDRTWEWIRETYGDRFDPGATHDRLAAIIRTYPEYDHVTVPDQFPH